jgi:WD40 repeat protein
MRVASLAAVLALLLLAASDRGSATRTETSARSPASLFNPVWSRFGKRVAWADTRGRIWVAAADGKRARPVTGRIDALGQIAWLPNGGILYWANFRLFRLQLGRRGVFLARVSGGNFALDRRARMAASGSPGCPLCNAPITILPITPRGVRGIVGGRRESDESPSFSPDGRRIAFSRTFWKVKAGEYDRPGGVWTATVSGRQLKRITKFGSCPEWSPDGRRILYFQRSLRLVPSGGGRITVLLRNATCNRSFPSSWSPNGRQIAAVLSSGRLAVVEVRAGRVRWVSKRAVGVVDDFAWSPDSKRLLIAARPTARACSSLWLVNASTGSARSFRRCR